MQFDKNTAFQSERLSYLGITKTDANLIVKWRNTPHIQETSFLTKHLTIKQHLNWFYNIYLKNPLDLKIIITEKKSNQPIGLVGGTLENDDFILSYYMADTKKLGFGFSGEAIWALMQHLQEKYNIKKFIAKIKTGNNPSVNCVKKLGFTNNFTNDEQTHYKYTF